MRSRPRWAGPREPAPDPPRSLRRRGSRGRRAGCERRAPSSAGRRRSTRLLPGPVVRPTGTAGRRRRPHRPRRRRSARRASAPSRRPDRRRPSPDGDVHAEPRRRALGHRHRDLRGHRPVRGQDGRRDAGQGALRLVGVRDEAAQQVGAGPRDLGQQVGDEPARARLGGADRQAPRAAGVADAAPPARAARRRSGARSSAALGLDRFVGRREQPRLGDAVAAERAERRAVEREVGHARRPGPDLDRFLAREREGLAARRGPCRRGRPCRRSCRRPRP